MTLFIQSTSDPDSLIKSLERELSNVHFFWFGNEPCLKKRFCCIDILLDRKDKVKYLGVYFDHKIQLDKQIKNITQKVSFKLDKIKSIAHFLTGHTKKLLLNALVMPYFH